MRETIPTRSRRQGITLVELLVVVVICAITLCLLLPALVRARKRTRENVCQQRLGRLVLSVQEFESVAGVFPSGVVNATGPVASEPAGMHHSWLVQLIPFIAGAPSIAGIDANTSVYDDVHASIRNVRLSAAVCPAAPISSNVSFAACHHDEEAPIDSDNNGVFFLNSSITRDDVVDGLAFTLFLGEKRQIPGTEDLGWMSGTRATLRNTGTALSQTGRLKPAAGNANPSHIDSLYVGGFGSWHVGVTHLAMGDGRVTATSNQMDPIAYRQLGHRRDGARLEPDPVGR